MIGDSSAHAGRGKLVHVHNILVGFFFGGASRGNIMSGELGNVCGAMGAIN